MCGLCISETLGVVSETLSVMRKAMMATGLVPVRNNLRAGADGGWMGWMGGGRARR